MIKFQGKILLRGAFRFGNLSFSEKGVVTWVDGSWVDTYSTMGLIDRMNGAVYSGAYAVAGPAIELTGQGFDVGKAIGQNGFTIGALVKATGPGVLWGSDTHVEYDGQEWVLDGVNGKVTGEPTTGWQTVIATVNKAGVGSLYMGSVKEGFDLNMNIQTADTAKFGQLPGQIAEMVAWDRALSVAERNQFNLYLQEKWQVG
jgi:hypothetical protein